MRRFLASIGSAMLAAMRAVGNGLLWGAQFCLHGAEWGLNAFGRGIEFAGEGARGLMRAVARANGGGQPRSQAAANDNQVEQSRQTRAANAVGQARQPAGQSEQPAAPRQMDSVVALRRYVDEAIDNRDHDARSAAVLPSAIRSWVDGLRLDELVELKKAGRPALENVCARPLSDGIDIRGVRSPRAVFAPAAIDVSQIDHKAAAAAAVARMEADGVFDAIAADVVRKMEEDGSFDRIGNAVSAGEPCRPTMH